MVDKDRFGGLTAYDTRRDVYGAQRRAILTHSPELRDSQARGFDGTTLAKAGDDEPRSGSHPRRGRLVLHDEPLTIPQLMALRLSNPSFAFLSACETYRGGTLIPDEGITLATALQLAGYQHVIGTLWQIGIIASDVARHFYDQVVIRSDDTADLQTDTAAAALRTAILDLLAESPGIPPLHWAAYIHTGP